MGFTLVVRTQSEQSGKAVSPQQFTQPLVTIGRGATSDLVLKDPQRRVSSRHAEIREKDLSWVLVDVGSTNGTALNDVRVIPRKEYVLHNGDRIILGDFLLTFEAEDPPQALQSQEANEVDVPPAVSVSPSLSSGEEIDKLFYLLRCAYADPEESARSDGGGHLEALLRRNVAHLDRQAGQSLLATLRRRVSTKAAPAERSMPDLAAGSVRPRGPSPSRTGAELASLDFRELVGMFCAHLDQPLSRDQLDQLARRIERVLLVVFAGLADAVKGRREFQREFEVEATRILDWSPNPIKHAETAEEIAALLLDPRSQRLSEEQAEACLREVFQDLTLHQLGLMAGFRECVRGLLKEFDPATFLSGGKDAGKALSLLGGRGTRSDAAAWQRFVAKHRQLTEEEVRVFEQILAPHFAKGYLSIQKTRRRKP